ncbi:MAG: GTPase (G3E family) [Lachnospiraceae bacterium]|nr:GTPase (G3E family) [Lachnospiraceae bacterium]
MHKIDLITGFLGSGKTTFIRKYVEYLLSLGERIGIIENDFGAINVDRVLLKDVLGDKCGMEMIIGGDDLDTHKRRMKTKLIAMAMNGYERVIIEPSGIFDVDELFDLLYEEPLDRMYEMGSVITVVDGALMYALKDTETDLSEESRYLICAQCACAGKIVLSKLDVIEKNDTDRGIERSMARINTCLEEFKCKRIIQENDCVAVCLTDIDPETIRTIADCGYKRFSHVKIPVIDSGHYGSKFCYHLELTYDELVHALKGVFSSRECGNIFRIKGYMNTKDRGWIEINSTPEDPVCILPADESENVIIIIGENMSTEAIQKYIPIQ